MATVRAEYSQMQIKCLFVKDVNMVTVQPQKAKADAPPPAPLCYCATTPHQQAKKAPIVSLQSLE